MLNSSRSPMRGLILFAIITIVVILLSAHPHVSSASSALLFEDDFSTDKGWVDESNGNIYRDVTNERLVWQVRRDSQRRYYIPIDARSDSIQLDFRFNVTGARGNGDVHIGLVENLDGPDPSWPFDVTGVLVQVSSDTAFGKRVRVLSKFEDGTLQIFPISGSPNYGSFNVWRQASFILNGTDWTTIVRRDDGTELGRQTGTLSDTHSEYRYLMVSRDYIGGWEWQNGYLDDIEVYGSPIEIIVEIDIKPGSDPNCFNNNGHGVIPVAILSTDSLDASTVDPLSVMLNGASARVKGKSGNAGSLEDVDGDNDLDLVVQIEDRAGTYQEGDTIATLTGLTFDGTPIVGTDSICIRP